MLCRMCCLRIFRRTSQKLPQEEVENASENPTHSNLPSTAMVGSMRPPLCPIKMQHHNDMIMRQLSESESSLRYACEKLKMAEIEFKQKDQQVQELMAALQALEVAKSNVELEKQQLILVADQASSRCSTKEQELYTAQRELACIHAKLEELEDKSCSVNAGMDQCLKQLKDLEEERSKLLADHEAQKSKWDDERRGLRSEKEHAEEEMTRKLVIVTEELAATQCKLKMFEDNLIESSLTTEALMLEKSMRGIEKQTLFKDAADAHDKVSDKEKEPSFFQSTLTEVQQKLKLTEYKVYVLTALINDYRSEMQAFLSKAEILQVGYIQNILKYTPVLAEKTHVLLHEKVLAETKSKDLLSQNASLNIELKCKEEVLCDLQFKMSLLQESASKEKDPMEEVQEATAALKFVQEELEVKQKMIDGLEEELLEMSSLVDHQMIHSIESMKCELSNATRERDCLQVETLVLNEQQEMARAIVDEQEAIAVEAHQVVETRKTYVEEKEEETKLLERFVEDIESTVNKLESQVYIVRREDDRQRLIREDMELELQPLKHQMLTIQSVHATKNNRSSSDSMKSATANQR